MYQTKPTENLRSSLNPLNPRRSNHLIANGVGLIALLTASAAANAGTLYFGHIFQPDFSDGFIGRIETDGSNLQTIIAPGGGLRGIAVDPAAGALYWADTTNVGIWRSDLDGGDPEQIVTTNLEFPRTVLLRQSDGNIYYGDQVSAFIGRAEADGSNPESVRSTAYHCGMAIDEIHGKLYWTTSDSDVKGKILRSNLDGSDQEIAVNSNAPQFKPAGLAIDPIEGKLYWTDYVVDVVRRSKLDGSDMEDLYVVGSNRNPRPIALDLTEGKVYWGQDIEMFGYTGMVMRMNLDGSDVETFVPDLGLVTEVTIVNSTLACNPCDTNCDGSVNQFDIIPFVSALSPNPPEPCSPCAADSNNDGSINAFDIAGFVQCLGG